MRPKGKRHRIAVVTGNRELGFLEFRIFASPIPQNESDGDTPYQPLSIDDKRILAKFYEVARKRR
jgi:hypothetical protein